MPIADTIASTLDTHAMVVPLAPDVGSVISLVTDSAISSSAKPIIRVSMSILTAL
ncbi:hypothetical protein D3C73_1619970 [compost metagenome]